MFKELAPALAMTMAGLSRDPRAVQNTANAWQMGTNQARYREKQEKDDRKQQETTQALGELFSGKYTDPHDFGATMGRFPNSDPGIVGNAMGRMFNLQAEHAENIVTHGQRMTEIGQRHENDKSLEGIRQGGMNTRAKENRQVQRDVAESGKTGRIKAAQIRADAKQPTSLSTDKLFAEYLKAEVDGGRMSPQQAMEKITQFKQQGNSFAQMLQSAQQGGTPAPAPQPSGKQKPPWAQPGDQWNPQTGEVIRKNPQTGQWEKVNPPLRPIN